ncbi:MAG: 2-phospho-L-lactate guanylyltransferase [Promethearchaeota archaeon]|nr:MAG: 2-phospho-L-lactate guanylyltransferase [Candidatus Lokiarchaeota archaeon]
MNVLLIPVAPLERSKSRLLDYFSRDNLRKLTIALMNDMGTVLSNLTCFDEIIIYCKSPEILELAERYELVGLKEEKSHNRDFNNLLKSLNQIAIDKFNAKKTTISFIDTILISEKNFREFSSLLEKNQLVISPSIFSAGISMVGRNPADIIEVNVFNQEKPSLLGLIDNAKKNGIKDIAIYDSFRAGFDVDIRIDLILGYEYLKILNLTERETFKFLEKHLKMELKCNTTNNRNLKIQQRNC